MDTFSPAEATLIQHEDNETKHAFKVTTSSTTDKEELGRGKNKIEETNAHTRRYR